MVAERQQPSLETPALIALISGALSADPSSFSYADEDAERPAFELGARAVLELLEPAAVAQLAEHPALNRAVGGSTPPSGTNHFEGAGEYYVRASIQHQFGEDVDGPRKGDDDG